MLKKVANHALPKFMISFGNIFLSMKGLRQNNNLKRCRACVWTTLCIHVHVFTCIYLFVYFSWFYWSCGENGHVFSTHCNIDNFFYSTGIVNKMFWVPNKIPVNRTECRCNCFDTVYKGRLISVYRKFEHFIVGLGGGGRVGPRF